MTPKTNIELAREAGMNNSANDLFFQMDRADIDRFATLIRADEREKLLGGSVEAVEPVYFVYSGYEGWTNTDEATYNKKSEDNRYKFVEFADFAARVAQMQAEIERLKAENDAITDLNHSQFLALENKRSLAEYPAKCPITRRDFFMVIEHPELGMVPTYGGPYDSYTIPEMGGKADQPWHERELFVHRYDHDFGGWVGDETIPLLVINDDELQTLQSRVDELEADASAFQTAADLGLTLRFYGGCAQSGMPGSPSAYEVVSGSDRATAMREAVSRCKAINDAARKQGGAQ